VWECETWRGAILAECGWIATAMGEWVQAGDDSWEGGGEEGRRLRLGGTGMDVIVVQLTGAAAQIGNNWIFIRLLGSVRL